MLQCNPKSRGQLHHCTSFESTPKHPCFTLSSLAGLMMSATGVSSQHPQGCGSASSIPRIWQCQQNPR